jgi:UDP-N-acetylglucosamine 2-epimerase (non-hydrolysing)
MLNSSETPLVANRQALPLQQNSAALKGERTAKRILLVSGTRPEIIKLAPVYQALSKAAWAEVSWLHTAQHGEMATQILASFGLSPDIVLQRPGSSLLDFSLACRRQLDEVLATQPWSMVVVQGDTESAFQGALAAFYHQVPLAHVEAGLRTGNLDRPFPEEGLRQMISRLARYQFAPTERSAAALRSEGIANNKIEVTGNTVVDAQNWTRARYAVKREVAGRGHLLVTAHRRENWGTDLAEICHAVAEIAGLFPQLQVLFPVHLNPIVQGPVREILRRSTNVCLVPPLDYLDMQQALADAWILLTDSGGLQEEAPTYQVPVLVLRNETERTEALDAGCARLIGPNRRGIVNAVVGLMKDPDSYARMQRTGNPFGDGRAAQRIVAKLARHFSESHATEPAFPG